RIDELLERLGLAEAANKQITSLSSGMRQKMNLIRGLMTDPRVLFLDEPTVALDVGAARDVRSEVQRWMREDPTRTVILTTHYMQEADELCDRVAIVNRGRIVAEGAPRAPPAHPRGRVREAGRPEHDGGRSVIGAAQRPEYPALRIFFKTIVARAYPRVMAANRQKTWLFFDMAFPVVGALAMVLVYEG